MLHCQDPYTMLIDQEFPVSAEMQLLGGLGNGERSTANICTPGTDVDIDGQIAKYHCINSNSLTYNEDDWVNVEVVVFSDSIIHHIVENDTVLSYTNIRVGGGEIPDNYVNRIGERLSDGFISLQSEGHPVEFREIKIKELKSERFGRNDICDREMISAAKLAMDLCLPNERNGDYEISDPEKPDYWLRKLFEKAIGNFYIYHLLKKQWKVSTGKKFKWEISYSTAGFDEIFPGMKTDIILDNKLSKDRIIIDTKFKIYLFNHVALIYIGNDELYKCKFLPRFV